MRRFAFHDAFDLFAGKGFVFQQALCQTFEFFLMVSDHFKGTVVTFVDDALHFGFDQFLGGRRNAEPACAAIGLITGCCFGIIDVPDLVRHTHAHHHAACQLAGLHDIAHRARGDSLSAVLENFCRFARHGHGDLLFGFVLEHLQLVHFGQAHHHAQSTATRNDRRLIDRITFRQLDPDDGVTGFVVGGLFLLVLRQDHRAAFRPHHDLVFGGFEIHHRNKATAHACRGQGGLVHKVRQIGTREAGRAACDNAQVHIRPKRGFASVHPKNLFATLDVGVAHGDLTVKAARTQQGRVQHVFAVGRGDDDHAFVRLKAVHFNQQLVQCLFALVVATTVARATGPAHGIDFVDENDTRCVFLGLFEHVAHAGGTDTDKHLNKIRTRDGEERHTRLTRNRTRQQCFTGTGRALKQGTFGDLAAQTAELLRVAQEFHDLFQLFFGFVDARNVVKGHAAMLFGQHLGLGLAKAHRPTFAAALHAVHEIDPYTDQQKDRQQRHQECLETGLLLGFGAHRNVLGHQQAGDLGVFGPDRDIVTAIGTAETNLFAIQRDVAHIACLYSGHKFRIADFAALHPASRTAEQVEQRQNQKHQYNPKGEIAHITQRKVSYIRGTAPNTAPYVCKIDTIGTCSMRHMCGEKSIFTAFEHCLPVLRPTDKGGSDQFHALPHRRRGQ